MTDKEYSAFEANGQQAQAYVGSVLRGGFVNGEHFFFVSTRRERVPVSSVRELKFAPYSA